MHGVGTSKSVWQEYSSLVELLRYRALHSRDDTAFRFVSDDGASEQTLSYAELDRLARCIAARIQNLTAPGDRALLLYPHGLDFITGFFGCLYAGVVAVPATAPRSKRNAEKLHTLIEDADPRLVLSTSSQKLAIERRISEFSTHRVLDVVATDLLSDGETDWREGFPGEGALAFMQYTSGSSGNPKGVMVSHGNIIHNERIIQAALGYDHDSILVSWAPLFHDMGLIASVVAPLYVGFPSILFSPGAFIRNPLMWLQLISQNRATSSGAPNFAFDHCTNSISAKQKASLDLSSWEMAYVGSEPVRAETLERFSTAFSSCGFRKEAFYPCYGMAEATLFISGGRRLTSPKTALLGADRVVPSGSEEVTVQAKVSCGFPWIDQKLFIVDPNDRISLPDGQVGEIWTSGLSVAGGYWNRPEETEETFGAYLSESGEGPFLRTGDLGFISEGELYVTGRSKDLIIIRGRNHCPQDIEQTVEGSHPSCSPAGAAAFSIEVDGDERVVVLQEVKRCDAGTVSTEEVFARVRRSVWQQHEIDLHAVVLLRPFSISKTSSGKIQRRRCRVEYLSGELKIIGQWCADADPSASDISSFAQRVSGNTGDELYDILLGFFRDIIPEILDLSHDELLSDMPLNSLGLDSLMIFQLMSKVKKETGMDVSLDEVMKGMTLAMLAAAVQSHLEICGIPRATRTVTSLEMAESLVDSDMFADGRDPGEILANLHLLSGEEKGRVLAKMLAEEESKAS